MSPDADQQLQKTPIGSKLKSTSVPPVYDQALETSLRLLGALMGNRACDWLDRARRDWEHTRHDAAEGYYEPIRKITSEALLVGRDAISPHFSDRLYV